MLGIVMLFGGDAGIRVGDERGVGERGFDERGFEERVFDDVVVVTMSCPAAAAPGLGAERCARTAMTMAVSPAIARTSAITVAARSDDRDRMLDFTVTISLVSFRLSSW